MKASTAIGALGAAWLLPAAALAHAASSPAPELPALSYFALGFEHILSGLDHLAFVGGLVAMQPRLRQLVWAVTAFSLAHSATLALAALGLIAPDARWVEPAIALSIAYVGLENLLLARAKLEAGGARIRLALLFGLLHGCGFGGALLELGLPEGAAAGWALAWFNLGVEAGQLAVVVGLHGVLRALARRETLRARLVPLFNAALVLAGVAWAAERVAAPATDRPLAAVAATGEAHDATREPAGAPDDDALPRPVYEDEDATAFSPEVRALCSVFQELPRRRRAECAGRTPGVNFAAQCRRALGASVAAGALRLEPAAAEACVRGMQRRYDGCDWIEEPYPYRAPLAACTRWAHGTRGAGDACRSSLECVEGLHCAGGGPLDRGVCAPPKSGGARCELAADPLAAYVQHDAERSHPECAGRCVRHRCIDERS